MSRMGNGVDPHAETRILDCLSSEYSIVQDKIDKIGAFRFTIRGWTVTLVTGAIFAIASTNLLSPYVLLFLIFLIAIFALIESRQNRNQDILEDRAFEIEAEFSHLLTVSSGSPARFITTPRIAHDIRDRSVQDATSTRRFLVYPDRWFYWLLGLVVVVVVLFLLYKHPQNSSSNIDDNFNVIYAPGSGASVPVPDKRQQKRQRSTR
jgi:uncharacterized membrane protein